ncbi:MAG: hypothetical protein B7Z26_02805 [Asticcacaulis sp. 32-58-5]|jgi:uncharacterized protein (DUF736 family)|nr:MAG: hypothetical protein B7Z26_02805 [Asticcacaulis sp. 32-58-5]
MSIIGTFVKSDSGYTGNVKTVNLNFKVRLSPIENPSKDGPQFRAYSGPAEIGAGWARTAENSREYISLKLDDPSFVAPIYASLFASDDGETYNLLWTRPQAK